MNEIANRIKERVDTEPPSKSLRVLTEFEEVLMYARFEKKLSVPKISKIVNEELASQGRKGVGYSAIYGFLRRRQEKLKKQENSRDKSNSQGS